MTLRSPSFKHAGALRAAVRVTSMVFLALASSNSEAQVSYRNSQGFAAKTHEGSPPRHDGKKAQVPLRFRGWNYGANNPEYLKRFQRPRSAAVVPGPRRPVSNIDLNKALHDVGRHS